jgi:hypothetical protein
VIGRIADMLADPLALMHSARINLSPEGYAFSLTSRRFNLRPFLDQVCTIVQAWIEIRRVYIFGKDYSFPIRLYHTVIQSDRERIV